MNDTMPQVNPTIQPETAATAGTVAMPTTPVLPTTASSEIKSPKTGSKINLLLGLGAVLLLIAIIVLLVVILTPPKNDVPATGVATQVPGQTATSIPVVMASTTPAVTATEIPIPTSFDSPARVRLTSPVAGTIVAHTTHPLVLTGKVQGFFEGTVHFRLLNANNIELYRDSFTVGDNYDVFADFSKTIDIPIIPEAKLTPTGKLQFFDVSMKDGSETVLQEVVVNLN
jgi:hypothetical protein